MPAPVLGAVRVGAGSTQQEIIGLLAEKWPQSVKQLQRSLCTQLGHSISYQAVHRPLKELQEQGVLERSEEGYRLHPDWLMTLSGQAKELHAQYQKDTASKNTQQKGTRMALTVRDAKEYIMRFIERGLMHSKQPVTVYACHSIAPLLLSVEEFHDLKQVRMPPGSVLVSHNCTPLTELCLSFWDSHGLKTAACKSPLASFDFAVCENQVLQVFYPKEVHISLEKLLKPNSSGNVNLPGLLEYAYEKKVALPMVETTNRSLARHLRGLVHAAVKRQSLEREKNAPIEKKVLREKKNAPAGDSLTGAPLLAQI